ncbi:MAG: hypothetical protein RJA25_76 [Bacteroidota bacterium]|jgi:hypothetical protein
MELTGKVIDVRERKGTKSDGVTEWVRYDVELNHETGKYPKNSIFSFSGEKFASVLTLKDTNVRIYFDIVSTWYNENPQTRLTGYKYEKR